MFDITNKKILLVRNDNIGDLICTTPAIEALRKKYPDNQIDIVVNSYNYDAIHKNPFINKIYCYTKPKHKKNIFDKIKAGIGKLKILLDIRKEKYDVVIIFRGGYSKSAELFAKITNAKFKLGVKNLKGKDNFNLHVEVQKDAHEVEFCFNCLKEFNVIYNNENTRFYINEKNITKYNEYNNILIFHISARMRDNQLEYKKLENIINSLNEKIYITAEPKDFNIAKKLAKQTKAIFVQTTSFLDLGAFVKKAKLFITLEGGSMHLAPAIGIKTIALFGKSNVNTWYPWEYKELVIKSLNKKANDIDENLVIKRIKENL